MIMKRTHLLSHGGVDRGQMASGMTLLPDDITFPADSIRDLKAMPGRKSLSV